MLHEKHHLSDEELLLAADAELSPKRSAEVAAHLADCPECAGRMKKIEIATESLVAAYRADLDSQLLPTACSRAALEGQITMLASESHPVWWRDWAGNLFAGPRLAYVLGVVLIVALGIRLLSHDISLNESRTLEAKSDAGPLLPEPGLTPGVTRPISTNQVCVPGPSDQMATIPLTVRRAVFHEYGMDQAQPRNFEVDHLITPELGGTDDIRNLWPEPYASTTWNAYVKDELENHLRTLVCEGKLDLPTAQRDIATDWIAAYQKYFHTDRPLSNVSTLIWNQAHERND